MNKIEIIKKSIIQINSPIIIERWENLERFIFEMWQQLWSPKDIQPIDLYFAFVDANIGYKMQNTSFDKDLFKT